MKNILIVTILLGLAWFGYNRHKAQPLPDAVVSTSYASTIPESAEARESASPFKCDGRTHCSHMTSCAEAKFFIQNCPRTEMDGNNDGVPCERQWCK